MSILLVVHRDRNRLQSATLLIISHVESGVATLRTLPTLDRFDSQTSTAVEVRRPLVELCGSSPVASRLRTDGWRLSDKLIAFAENPICFMNPRMPELSEILVGQFGVSSSHDFPSVMVPGGGEVPPAG